MSSQERILFITTSWSQLGDTGEKTGFHFEELSTPYYEFRDAGFDVEIASIKGGQPPHDPSSLPDDEGKRPESVKRFLNDDEAMRKLRDTKSIESVDAGRYEAIYLPGGHGTMWDFATDRRLGDLIASAWEDGKVIGAVCHGPAALVEATLSNGEPLVKGKRVNSFTNAEERAVEKQDIVPFLLESRLKELGATFEGGERFETQVVSDERLVTGQNPASAKGVARRMIDALRERRERKAA